MNILSALRHTIRANEEPEVRKQFNWKINPEIGASVRFVAKKLQFPIYCIVEHGLQIAMRQLLVASRNPELRNVLNVHLETIHLLGNGEPDDEVVLRLGEINDCPLILARAQSLLRAYRNLKIAMNVFRRTKDFSYYQKYKRAFDESAIRFADWLEHPNRIHFKDKKDFQDETGDGESAIDTDTLDEE